MAAPLQFKCPFRDYLPCVCKSTGRPTQTQRPSGRVSVLTLVVCRVQIHSPIILKIKNRIETPCLTLIIKEYDGGGVKPLNNFWTQLCVLLLFGMGLVNNFHTTLFNLTLYLFLLCSVQLPFLSRQRLCHIRLNFWPFYHFRDFTSS